ncbi:MAG: MATE family efflux transporter [Eubacteriales bacterium]|nr:MATE family efflux transporter [Eubacteriales bacterium]
MDFLKTDIKKLYFRFLFPSMMSAIVTSIYFFVDAIGRAEGALGTAALAIISPTYGVMTFLAVLCGVGGSVMMSMAKGQGEEEKGNACFTAAVALMGILAIALWGVFAAFMEPIFTLFGANAEIMPKAVEYEKWIIGFLPVFVFSTFMSAFIRNDGAPHLAMAAVILGGGLNVLGDWLLVFPM